MKFLYRNWFKLFIVIVVVFILYIAYENMVVQPRKVMEQERLENFQKELEISREKADKKLRLDNCIKIAFDTYSANWDNACIADGKSAGCESASRYLSEDVINTYKSDEQICYDRFGD